MLLGIKIIVVAGTVARSNLNFSVLLRQKPELTGIKILLTGEHDEIAGTFSLRNPLVISKLFD